MAKITSYLEAVFLPILLAILFVLQNLAFNQWLGLYSKTYSSRLFLSNFALGIILYGPVLFFTNKKRYKFAYLFLVSSLVSLLFCAQFLYYKYSQGFLQFSAIKYVWQAGSVARTIKILLKPELLLFLVNIFTVLVALALTFRKNYLEFALAKWQKLFVGLFILSIAFLGYKYLLYTEKKEWGNTSRLYTDVYDLKTVVEKMGIVNFFAEDTFKYVLRNNYVSLADKNFLASFAKAETIPQTKNKYFGLEKGKNVIIIQVESLENAVINQKINGQEITPNLNRLAKDGLYFNNYYAQVGPGNTADAEFSTMTSLYPLPDDVVFINYAKNQYEALPKTLANNGYQTYSMHGDVPTFWNRSNIYPVLGYQKAFGLSDYTVTRSVGQGPSDLGDEDLFSQSLPKMENFKQPFLSTLITMSSHTPFILPEDLQTLQIPPDTSLDKNQQEYLQSIHYADKAIGEFIDGLKKDGLYNNSVILIWGDHGSFTNISQAPLANSNVPLIILASNLKISGTNSAPASHIDIFPTIVNLLGIQAPKTVLGQDILNTKTPVETHFKLVSGGIDVILTQNLTCKADDNGTFSNGPCQDLYNQQFEKIKASNIIIKGNLLNVLLTK